jgi:hypothetical protein
VKTAIANSSKCDFTHLKCTNPQTTYSSIHCAHSFKVQEELEFLLEMPPVLLGSAEATGEPRCVPDVRKLIGTILLDRLREESGTSVEPGGLLLEIAALLDELPPRSVIPNMTPCT